jgi:hypothetical protein
MTRRAGEALPAGMAVRGEAFVPFAPVPNRGMITISIMLANIMQGVDNTILNVAVPHIQGSDRPSEHRLSVDERVCFAFPAQ